jgi:hypothetical protein
VDWPSFAFGAGITFVVMLFVCHWWGVVMGRYVINELDKEMTKHNFDWKSSRAHSRSDT